MSRCDSCGDKTDALFECRRCHRDVCELCVDMSGTCYACAEEEAEIRDMEPKKEGTR